VGCSLAGIAIIALVVFLVLRRKKQVRDPTTLTSLMGENPKGQGIV
jgi:hypothetical protein